MLRRFVVTTLPLVLLGVTGAFPALARAASGYVNPFSTPDYYVGRTDMGVDICLSAGDPIAAVGNGVVVGVQKNWFEKQPYIWYELTSGPYAGRYVYVAEQINHVAHVGDQLTAGETLATYAGKGTCIETGWSTVNGETLAVATTGYKEGAVTPAGISFARFLISLGVQGTFELSAPKAQPARKRHRRTSAPKAPSPAPTTHSTKSSHPRKAPTSSVSGGGTTAPTDSGGSAFSSPAQSATATFSFVSVTTATGSSSSGGVAGPG